MGAIQISATLLLFFSFSISASQSTGSHPSMIDPYAFLHIIPTPDGSITRIKQFFPTVPPNSTTLAISKDVPLNPDKNTSVRIYLPNGSDPLQPNKLPVIVFAHGGGFIYMSSATPKFDTICSEFAGRLGALVVSVEYRLAPEHRLPAAYDDVLDALFWIKEGKDEWVRHFGDVSRCLLTGESAGGNIAYILGLRAATLVNELNPLTIRGLVLIQPFFGGVKPTESELRLVNDKVLPLVVNDLLWELCLPVGANRNHKYCNPIIGGGSHEVVKIKELGWQVGVLGCDGDPLFDRQVELVEMLKTRRVNVMSIFDKGGSHGIFSEDPPKVEQVLQVMREIISSCSSN